MAGMLQIITYLLAVLLIAKGVEILQIALASNRPRRRWVILIGIAALLGCSAMAILLSAAQEIQAVSLSQP